MSGSRGRLPVVANLVVGERHLDYRGRRRQLGKVGQIRPGENARTAATSQFWCQLPESVGDPRDGVADDRMGLLGRDIDVEALGADDVVAVIVIQSFADDGYFTSPCLQAMR